MACVNVCCLQGSDVTSVSGSYVVQLTCVVCRGSHVTRVSGSYVVQLTCNVCRVLTSRACRAATSFSSSVT